MFQIQTGRQAGRQANGYIGGGWIVLRVADGYDYDTICKSWDNSRLS